MLVDINLLPKRLRTSSFLIVLLGVFVLIWLLMLTVFMFVYFDLRGDIEAAEVRKAQLIEQRLELEQQQASTVGRHNVTLQEAVEHIEKLTVPTTILIDDLMNCLPDHAYLSTFSYNNGLAAIQTQFETLEDISLYVTQLTESPFLVDVKVNTITSFEFDWEDEGNHSVIPRYDVNFTLEVDRGELVKGLKQNERMD
ncbi:PilN domain-containing protein [Anaerobacillus sp. MEB173]|uniref:PilN domain-containing protein n=1 Tax=Anaerobacillus sp. MEB173 TaxID=3383345 RepID=UPI003F919E58